MQMNWLENIKDINSKWILQRSSLSKEDFKYILARKGFNGVLRGFLTKEYYKRKKLVETGEIIYGYCFKMWSNSKKTNEADFPVWVIHSPMSVINEKPEILRDIAFKCLDFASKNKDSNDKFANLINKPLSDTLMFPVPEECSNNHLCYLSIIERRALNMARFSLGLNLFISSPSVTREILFLPDRYWSEEFRNGYEPAGYPL